MRTEEEPAIRQVETQSFGAKRRRARRWALSSLCESRELTWMVWPKRRTAPFFTGEMRLASDVTLPRGRTRFVLGS